MMNYKPLLAIGILIIIQSLAKAPEATAIPTIAQQAPEKIEKIEAPFKMPQLKRPVFKDQTFNITQYGAKGDGKKRALLQVEE